MASVPSTIGTTSKNSASHGRRPRLSYRAKSASRTPVARLLPVHVRAECRKLAARGAECAVKEVAQLHERLEIERRYGVTRRRLHNYLARLCKQEPAKTDSPESERSDNEGATPPVVDMMQHRQRQASIAAILEATFGRFAQSAPDLWDRRAYLLMVGLVYERLAADEQEVTTDELVALSRVLQRKPVTPPAKDSDRNGAEAASPGARPSERFRGFAEAVRAVYGTSLPLPDDDVDPSRPGNNHVSETSGGVGE